MNQIGVIMGSDSDYQVMEEALEVLRDFEVPFEVIISSAQRTLKRTVDWVKGFEAQGGKLIIAAAGLAAPLARSCGSGNDFTCHRRSNEQWCHGRNRRPLLHRTNAPRDPSCDGRHWRCTECSTASGTDSDNPG